MKGILFVVFLFIFQFAFGQTYVWTGNGADNNFRNVINWKDSVTGLNPASGAFDNDITGVELVIEQSDSVIVAAQGLKFINSSLRIENAGLSTDFISGGNVTVGNSGYINLTGNEPLKDGVRIDFVSGVGWVKTDSLDPETIFNDYLQVFSINGSPAAYQTNLRIDNYYSKGSVIRSNSESTKALTIYEQSGFQGDSVELVVNTVFSGSTIPGSFNNKTASFRLRRGFMVTLADIADGTGLSKNYIASEKDLNISELPPNLQGNISFIRVLPWNWVSKKGIGGNVTGLNETWHYNWANTGNSSLQRENVPMAWGKGGADDPSDIELYNSKYKTAHVLAFNESDNCNDQSGQYGDLCNTDVAVATYQNLMKTGLRLVSPSCRENAPFGWLKEFYDKATAQNIRIDVIGVHWYDWGSNPANSPNADPQQVFNRFKNYLQNVHNLYGLPIWITEFNANPNRTGAVNLAFMKLALPYLETLDYVERYAWFQPSSGVADYYDGSGNYTEAGLVYKNQQSGPSISEAVYSSPSNLNDAENGNSPVVFEDYFETYTDGQNLGSFYTVWEGAANAVDENITTTWGAAFEGDKFGKSDNAKNNFYLRKTFELEAGKTYVWELATKMTDGAKHVMSVLPADAYPALDCTNSEWQKHAIEFTVVEGKTLVTLSLYRYPTKNLYFDNYVLTEKETSTATNDEIFGGENDLVVYPNPVHDVLNILSLLENSEGREKSVYNLHGKLMMVFQEANPLNVSSLPPGIYFLRWGDQVVKFVKN